MVFLGLEEAGRNVLITLLKEDMSLGQGLSWFCTEALVNLRLRYLQLQLISAD